MNNSTPIAALLVEDNPGDAELIKEMLSEAFEFPTLHQAPTIAKACVELKNREDIQIILLDLNLPDSEGLNTLAKILEHTPDKPIIVLTGYDNEELSLSAIQAGAQDYLVKGKINAPLLLKTINFAMRRFEAVKKINATSPIEKSAFATYDLITELPGQHLFLESLQNSIEKASELNSSFVLTFVKLHEIQDIIRIHGFAEKNNLLKFISLQLIDCLRKSNSKLFQFQEDIFAITIPVFYDIDRLVTFLNSLQQQLHADVLINQQHYTPTFSISCAIFPNDGKNNQELINAATIALKRAEDSGFNHYCICNDEIKVPATSFLHSDILNALGKKEFYVVYQPQVDLRTRKTFGIEALLRWKHPVLGLVNPDIFIGIAEERRIITPIGEWVCTTVFEQMMEWQRRFDIQQKISLDINVSVQQLQHSSLYDSLKKLLHKCKIPPYYITLEITESIFLSQPKLVIQELERVKGLGISIAIDDFGKGYSSLSYLSHLPIDQLKLDIEFIRRIETDKATQTVVETVIRLAHDLNLVVVAEGVEKVEQCRLLKQLDCDVVQGFYFSKPITADQIEKYIKNDDFKWDLEQP